jgi:hypothetical protein
LYVHFFQPVLKLVHKERQWDKVCRRYDQVMSPHRQVMRSPDVSARDKLRLQQLCLELNPAAL